MEKNGNTVAPDQQVFHAPAGQKTASSRQGKVTTVDPDQGIALVKWADTGAQSWVPVGELVGE